MNTLHYFPSFLFCFCNVFWQCSVLFRCWRAFLPRPQTREFCWASLTTCVRRTLFFECVEGKVQQIYNHGTASDTWSRPRQICTESKMYSVDYVIEMLSQFETDPLKYLFTQGGVPVRGETTAQLQLDPSVSEERGGNPPGSGVATWSRAGSGSEGGLGTSGRLHRSRR